MRSPSCVNSLDHLDLRNEKALIEATNFLGMNLNLIFFFLNQFVFPENCFEYYKKISGNSFNLASENDRSKTTGFSGTDEKKSTIPHFVSCERTNSQKSTNGKMIQLMLQEKNSQVHFTNFNNSIQFLDQLNEFIAKRDNCNALIDAGALIIGISNKQTAEYILNNSPQRIQGVIFFNDDGSVCVTDRQNKCCPIESSKFPQRKLFGYFDQQHTRGADFKLPLDTHAVLTCSTDSGFQRDSLIQAAMRLRQLEHTQSFSLWAEKSLEVLIRKKFELNGEVGVKEVLYWAMSNSIESINESLYSVATNSFKFELEKISEEIQMRNEEPLDFCLNYLCTDQFFTVEKLYGRSREKISLSDCFEENTIKHQKYFCKQGKDHLGREKEEIVRRKRKHLVELFTEQLSEGFTNTSSLENDEEKQIEVEILQIQQLENPIPSANPQKEIEWSYDKVLKPDFFQIFYGSLLFPLKICLSGVHEFQDFEPIFWSKDLFCTKNFQNTVTDVESGHMDEFLKPLDAFLVFRGKQTRFVFVSRKEAHFLNAILLKNNTQNEVSMMFIDDANGPTVIPYSGKSMLVGEQEIRLLLISQIFNGSCHFPEEMVPVISKFLGKVAPNLFSEIGEKEIFSELMKAGVIDSLGFLFNFTGSVSLPNQSNERNKQISKLLNSFVDQLIFDFRKSSCKQVIHALSTLVKLRGKLKNFKNSILETILYN